MDMRPSLCASHQTSNIRVAWYITEEVVESIKLILVTTIKDRIRGRSQWCEVVNQIVGLSCCVRDVNEVSSVWTDNCNTIFSCVSNRDDVSLLLPESQTLLCNQVP